MGTSGCVVHISPIPLHSNAEEVRWLFEVFGFECFGVSFPTITHESALVELDTPRTAVTAIDSLVGARHMGCGPLQVRSDPVVTVLPQCSRKREIEAGSCALQVTLSREGELLQWKFRKPQCGDSARVIVTNLPSRASWQDLKDFMRTVSLAPSVVYADVRIVDRLAGKAKDKTTSGMMIVYSAGTTRHWSLRFCRGICSREGGCREG